MRAAQRFSRGRGDQLGAKKILSKWIITGEDGLSRAHPVTPCDMAGTSIHCSSPEKQQCGIITLSKISPRTEYVSLSFPSVPLVSIPSDPDPEYIIVLFEERRHAGRVSTLVLV